MIKHVFHAISDPVRREIIMLLSLKPLTHSAIARKTSITNEMIVIQLQILLKCDLVKPIQKGAETFYKLQLNKMKEIGNWVFLFNP